MTEAEMDAIADRLADRLQDRGTFQLAAEEAVLKYKAFGIADLPRLLVASFAARGVYLRINEHGALVANRHNVKIEEELKALLRLYKWDVMNWLKANRPQAVALPEGRGVKPLGQET